MNHRSNALPIAALAAVAVLSAAILVSYAAGIRAAKAARALGEEALAAQASGRSAEALQSLDDALAGYQADQGPSFSRPYSGRGAHAVLLGARARLQSERGNWEDAATDALAASKLGSREFEALRARALTRSAKLFDAVEAYDRAVDWQPAAPELRVERGELLLRLVRLQQAVDDETKALELGAEGDLRLKAFLIRGRTRLAMGDFDSGIKDLGAVLETDGSNPLARLLRGQARFERRDYDGALEDALALSKADPMNGPAYLLRAEANLAKGRRTEAKHDLREAQKLMPGHPRVTQLFQQLRKA